VNTEPLLLTQAETPGAKINLFRFLSTNFISSCQVLATTKGGDASQYSCDGASDHVGFYGIFQWLSEDIFYYFGGKCK
jgi:hypothetical protein